ncbi:hypothetical protein HZH66_003661 [Vespula vulgaris]|uniref:oleoyl-[acyl-carrier-protein] hydrolase n=1 Tax=Vespula vulgaris TaxID=7454 RepID=A0A834KDW5_VESVU|nr:hypothetical protein HZH66_003661 [Vespula vulgaris]
MRINLWKSCGVNIKILVGLDAADRDASELIVKTAIEQGPVDGIFNLAVSLKDVEEGFPGLAIQWGAIGDVGLVAEMQNEDKEFVIGGTLLQRISSCLQELNGFLVQDKAVVASMVVAAKRGDSDVNNIVDAVLKILCIKDLNSINQHTSLPELGMDSMTAIEIKQTLEREYDVYLTASDIRNLNFAKLIEMNNKSTDNSNLNENDTNQILSITNMLRQLFGEVSSTELAIPLKTNPAEDRGEIFFLPGIEGYADVFKTLESNIKSPATCFQFALIYELKTVEAMANSFLPLILDKLKDRSDFLLVGYSFGSVLAIELTRMLEAKGFIGRLILIDGAPQHLKIFIQQNLRSSSQEELDNNILLDIMNAYVGLNVVELELELTKCNSWDEKLNAFFNVLSPEHKELFLKGDRRKAIHSLHVRLQAVMAYNPEPMPYLRTPITLFKPQLPSVLNAAYDYGLKNITEAKVDVHTVEGNHTTILGAKEILMAINGEPFENAATIKKT